LFSSNQIGLPWPLLPQHSNFLLDSTAHVVIKPALIAVAYTPVPRNTSVAVDASVTSTVLP
jgi:hypothetical protein